MSQIDVEIPVELFANADISYDPQQRLGWVPFEIRATVPVATAANAIVAALPAGHAVEAVVIKAQAVGADPIATGTHMGVGITGTPAFFVEVAEASVNESKQYIDQALLGAPKITTAATNMIIASTNGSGAAAGTLTGTWLIHARGQAWFGIS